MAPEGCDGTDARKTVPTTQLAHDSSAMRHVLPEAFARHGGVEVHGVAVAATVLRAECDLILGEAASAAAALARSISQHG
jgi:hypothetical protein